MINKLTTAFTDAFCVHPVPEAICACGQPYKAEEGQPPLRVCEFAGQMIVAGCNCKPSDHLANLFWGARHQVASFYRNALEMLDEDRKRLVNVMPESFGIAGAAQKDPTQN